MSEDPVSAAEPVSAEPPENAPDVDPVQAAMQAAEAAVAEAVAGMKQH